VTRRLGRRREQLLDDLKETRGYWKLKEEALAHTLRRILLGRGYGNVCCETDCQINAWLHLKECQVKPLTNVTMKCRIGTHIYILVNSLKTFPVGRLCLLCPWGKHYLLELQSQRIETAIWVATVRRYLRLLSKRPAFFFHVSSEFPYHRWPFCEFLKQQNKHSGPLHEDFQAVRQVRWQTCIKLTPFSTSRHWYDVTHS